MATTTTTITTTSLNTCTVQQPRATINRIHILLHFTATLSILYYRFSLLLHGDVPLLSWLLITIAELVLSFIWFFTQSFRWQPVVRKVSPENLPPDSELPAVDVFICTADPTKEPTLEVMNTVLSAMALDYPPEKLAVYLSDDGGASSTLYAINEACCFAKSWLPFCRKYGIKTICPEAYFSSIGDDDRLLRSNKFKVDEGHIKEAYEVFKKNVEKAGADSVTNDRPPRVEVIHDKTKHGRNGEDQMELPLLVYVSREKRPSRPHRYKAGALNTLLRVSGLMSNAPYMVVLDCDMYCNDPSSAKQAMCFHLDPKLSRSLAYVQYPQVFYNVSKKDIYDGQARGGYKTKYQGMDGVGGTVCSGTGYYIKKKALYTSPNQQDEFFLEPEQKFGLSSKFIASLKGSSGLKANEGNILSEEITEEARILASCAYEENTQWGKEIGYSYGSLLESTFTGYLVHSKGWKSVYLYPNRPCFLGCTTIDMKDAMVQLLKWSSGLLQIGSSRFSPLVYGVSRMRFPQSMCYAYFTFLPLLTIPCVLYGIVPQLCFLNGIPLFPKVSDPWFMVFLAVYLSSLCQHLYEVLSSGGTIATWWNEQRIWVIKGVTALLFGCLDALAKQWGITKASFRLTNKAIDKEKLEKYEKGKFDVEGARLFMVPLILLALLNMVCIVGGIRKVIMDRKVQEMFCQVYISSLALVFSYPILTGLISGKRK